MKIRNAFPFGYFKGNVIQFTLTGLVNPATTKPTHGILVSFFYEFVDTDGVTQNEFIDIYCGKGLTFTALPSPFISMNVTLDSRTTGHSNENMIITGSTPVDKIIA